MDTDLKSPEIEAYKRQLRSNLKALAPIFAKAAIGDFSENAPIPKKEDELTIFYVGVQIILDAIREKIDDSQAALIKLNVANADLEHEKAVYHAILSSIGEGLIVVDKDARITLLNQMAADLLGIDMKTAIGLNYYDMIVSKDSEGAVIPVDQRPLYLAITTAEQQVRTLGDGFHYERSDGTIFPVSISASPVKLGKEVLGCVSTFRDISVEKQLDRTKSEIISIASHQLRTPLTAIKWVSEQLMSPMEKLSQLRRRNYLWQIHASNERMITLVNDLLNVSRVELGTLSLNIQTVNVEQLLSEVLTDLDSQIKQKHLKIKKKLSKGLRTVQTDPRHIQVILQNLLSNAVKYSSARKQVNIVIELKHDTIHFMISDQGCGIPKAQQDKVFTKLFRADNARLMIGEGSGLGLYVCKAMAEQLQGTIRFKSIENKGSDFFVTIPLGAPAGKTTSS